jgi:microcin C transport system substrate-binding protein
VTVSRRRFLHCIGVALAGAGGTWAGGVYARGDRAPNRVSQPSWRHGLSQFGDLKYPPGFPQFDYVNANAPKGGSVRKSVMGTFDNFNMVPAGVKGNIAAGIELIHDTLLLPSLDEPSSEYGLLAEALTYPPDFSYVSYRLRPQARWHDGTPITAEDVVFSFDAFKHDNAQLSSYYRHVVQAKITAEREVTFSFDSPGNRELPLILGQLTVLPKHWWEGDDASGARRKIAATTLEPPLASGPYRIKRFEPGRTIVYERVKDYWGEDLNVRRGCNNFDELRFDYFRDLTSAFEAFKAGDLDWRVEYSAKTWATGYDFPALAAGRVVLEEFPVRNMGLMQAFAFNVRRPKFKNPQARRALNFAFDFESINKQIFHGQYERVSSYFQGTELASSGLPQGKELELLQSVREHVPAEVFTKAYWNPVGGSDETARGNLLHGMELLKQAGFRVENLQLIDTATGEPMQVEFLIRNPGYKPIILIYKAALERLGIGVTVRLVDPVQYENRLREWDFDIVVNSWIETLSPGNEQRDYWGSNAAQRPGSRNIVGISNHAVDALIDHVVFARNRAELVAATKALDRVLLWNHYVVPQWTYQKLRTARWDRYGRPQVLPKYGVSAFPTIWWRDAQLVAKSDGSGG